MKYKIAKTILCIVGNQRNISRNVVFQIVNAICNLFLVAVNQLIALQLTLLDCSLIVQNRFAQLLDVHEEFQEAVLN